MSERAPGRVPPGGTAAAVPPALLAAVARDLRPVRPLGSPGRRALRLAPISLSLLVVLPVFWAWFRATGALAPWPTWGLSLVESAIGLAVVAAAFREAVPGRELPGRGLVALAALAAVAFLAINATTRVHVPTTPTETLVRWIAECIGMVTAFSVPCLVLPAWLVARGLPRRPAVAGALSGLGVGLMADAGLHLCCWAFDLPHALAGHGGGVVILVALGAAAGVAVERIKSRRR